MAQFSSLYTMQMVREAHVCKSSSKVYEQGLLSTVWNKI